jgi:3-oxoacyl-[acyl-carrier-protein] synthase II
MSRPPQHRAVITGMGIVSALGVGKDAFWSGLQRGVSPIRPLSLFDVSQSNAKHAAWIDDWHPRTWIAHHRLKRMDRCVQFAVAAAHMAIKDAGIALSSDKPNPRAGVSFGTALGGFGTGELAHNEFTQHGAGALPPSLGLQVFPGSAQGNLAIDFGLQGIGTTNANTCAAGNVALADALRFIQLGKADVILAGSAETPITPMIYAAFDRLGTMAAAPVAQPYRPYHRERDGFVMGEGAALFVVESLAHARARGARIYAEIMGAGATNEAHHMSTPDAAGVTLQTAMRLALEDAELHADQIDYISPHASGTQANDVNELNQVRAVFGSALDRIAISGTKPFTGHTLGCAGAMEAATCLLALEHQWLPPTLGLDDRDPASQGFNIIANAGCEGTVRRVLSNSLGFGGINTSLVLGRLSE